MRRRPSRRGCNVKMHRRLQRLRQKVPEPGSPGCCDRRGRIVLVQAHRLADGSVVLRGTKPEACGLCGAVPEHVVKLILSVAGGPDQPEDAPGDNTERP
jgi:hypothetical protein